MAKSRSYVSDLIESLKDPVEAAEYLNAALEDGESEIFLLALRDVVESRGGLGKLATSTLLNRENLYRMLSSKGNPEFFSLCSVLDAIGFRLAVELKSMGTKKIVLHTFAHQVKESMSPYALAADSDSNQKTEVMIRTSDEKDLGVLSFDYKQSTLFVRFYTDVSIGDVTDAEIRMNDGAVLNADVFRREKDLLILLRRQKIFPKDVAQITLTLK